MSKEISRRLSYVLRHRPDSIGVTLDAAGWVAVDALLAALARAGMALTESYAMTPAASVSGLYLAHEKARYFSVGSSGSNSAS